MFWKHKSSTWIHCHWKRFKPYRCIVCMHTIFKSSCTAPTSAPLPSKTGWLQLCVYESAFKIHLHYIYISKCTHSHTQAHIYIAKPKQNHTLHRFSSPKDTFIDFREKGKEREGVGEGEKHWCKRPIASRVHPTGERTCNLGMCTDRNWTFDLLVCRTTP